MFSLKKLFSTFLFFQEIFARERLLQHGLFCDEQDTRTLGNDFDKIINGEESRKGTVW